MQWNVKFGLKLNECNERNYYMYYLLEIDTFPKPRPYRIRTMGWNEDEDDYDFIIGNIISTTYDKPFEFELWESKKGNNGYAEFYYESFPLMSDKLIEALKEAGVDNIQLFPAVLKDLKTGFERSDYKVVNVIGKLKAADMEKSNPIDMGGSGAIAVGFKNLTIDMHNTHGLLLFRLAESITSLVIHESVKNILEKKEFKYLRYLPSDKN